MFLMTKPQARKARRPAKARAGAAPAKARRQARRAAVQAGPLTAGARLTVRKGIHHARSWAAPRLDRTGNALEEQLAPKMAAMLSAAAHRIDPAPSRRRRWPLLVAGLAASAGLGATAAYLAKRRGRAETATITGYTDSVTDTTSAVPAEPASPVMTSEVNGRVPTG